MRRVFVDTWAWRALADRGDAGHRLAAAMAVELARQGAALTTTDYVLDEALTGLRRWIGLRATAAWLARVQEAVAAGAVDLAWIDAPRFQAAAALFARLNGKFPKLSFTDCTSFAVMRELGMEEAFTADDHFVRTAGFRRLVEMHEGGFRRT